MTADLAAVLAFVRARLDEDEQTARAATPGPWRHGPDKHWRKPGTSWFEEAVFAGPAGSGATCVAGTGETDDRQSMADAAFIARHDPARVLAEVAAKRAIVGAHGRDHECISLSGRGDHSIVDGKPWEHWELEHSGDAGRPCYVLRQLAAVWADHPDYDPSWAPDA